MKSKICPKCKSEKDFSEFYSMSGSKSKQTYCIQCMKDYNKKKHQKQLKKKGSAWWI
tara:strand:+ start:107 stop:277 length:171 start_codon:yes stop_codon:yes gene_type:complete